MDNRFQVDQEVKSITYPDDSVVTVGIGGVEKITVVMENGQMAGVPWFAVWINGAISSKHNAAHLATIEL